MAEKKKSFVWFSCVGHFVDLKKYINSLMLMVSPFTPEMASLLPSCNGMKKINASNWLWSFAANQFWYCQPDVIHSKILFNIYIKVNELKEGEKPPFIKKCSISATQGVGMIYC